VPIVLGGSPDAPANLDLLPWAGHRGERRKELLTAMLNAAIAGNWPAAYGRFARMPCGAGRADVAITRDDSGS